MNRIKAVFGKIKAAVIKNKKNVLCGAIAIIVLATALIYYFVAYNNKNLSAEEAAAKALAYIDQIITAQGSTYTTAMESVTEESGVYAVTFKIATYEYVSYITKDGKYLFPDAYDMSEIDETESSTNTTETVADTCDTLTKADSPVLEAFVVSACPYGLQMQRILAEVVELIPSLSENIKVRYIGSISDGEISSMHGDTEAQ